MRYATVLLLPLFFICSCASTPPVEEPTQAAAPTPAAPATAPVSVSDSAVASPEKQRLAVLDMEDSTGDIDDESLKQATEYLRALVVQSQRFIVVSDEEKQALISELRKESHGEQYDESQQVALGQRVAANTALISTILKIQENYILKAELVDLAKASIIAGSTEKFDPGNFQQAIEAVAQAVTTGQGAPGSLSDSAVASPTEAPAVQEAPAEDTSVTADYDDDDRYHRHHNRDGVNFFIINILASHHGYEPDPWYRREWERREWERREREEWRREHAEHEHHADEPTHHHADEPTHEHTDSAMHEKEQEPPADTGTPPTVDKPIRFVAPLKPIRFTAPAKKQPSTVTLGQQPSAVTVRPNAVKKETPAPVYTLPPKREKEATPAPVFRAEPKKSEPAPVFRAEPKKSEPTFKRQEPAPNYKKSQPAAAPRPIFTPSKSVTPTKKKEKKNDDDDNKKEEKKKPSKSNFFIPRKR